MNYIPFSRLARRLKKAGFKVEISKQASSGGSFIYSLGVICPTKRYPIRGRFTNLTHNQWLNPPGGGYVAETGYATGALVADHEWCFDKWSKCPVRILLPKNLSEEKVIVSQLRFLATEEGHRRSNLFETEGFIYMNIRGDLVE